jgi:hypothetical protein
MSNIPYLSQLDDNATPTVRDLSSMANATNTASKDINALKAPKFNAANTATGTTSVTINATSGIANFTDIIPSGGIRIFEVSNSLVTTNHIIQYSLRYLVSNAANPVVMFYNVPYDGLIRFRVINFGDLATNTEMSISFQILA